MRFKSNLETHTEHLDLRYEYEPYILPNTKIGGAKDYGKNYANIRPPFVRHLLRNCLSTRTKLFISHVLISNNLFTLPRLAKGHQLTQRLQHIRRTAKVSFVLESERPTWVCNYTNKGYGIRV